MANTTLRKELDDAGFDWETGRIAYQPSDENDSPGYAKPTSPTELISFHHPILDKEFYPGYGGPMMPRFIAEDAGWVYFPLAYDGSTCVMCIRREGLDGYLGTMESTPYPGG